MLRDKGTRTHEHTHVSGRIRYVCGIRRNLLLLRLGTHAGHDVDGLLNGLLPVGDDGTAGISYRSTCSGSAIRTVAVLHCSVFCQLLIFAIPILLFFERVGLHLLTKFKLNLPLLEDLWINDFCQCWWRKQLQWEGLWRMGSARIRWRLIIVTTSKPPDGGHWPARR